MYNQQKPHHIEFTLTNASGLSFPSSGGGEVIGAVVVGRVMLAEVLGVGGMMFSGILGGA